MQHSRIISGVDLGTSKITTIIGQYFESEGKFNVIAVSSLPSNGFRKGQIINLEEATNTITQSIESAERMAGFQIENAVVSITAPHIESLNAKGVVTVNNPGDEITAEDTQRVIDAAKAVNLPMGKEIIHVVPRIYTVDGQEGIVDPIGMSANRLEIEAHLILGSSPALKNLHRCLEDIGLKTDDIVYSGLATAKAAITDTEKELGVALIDIGGSNTSITIFSESSPCYCAVLPVGANNVTNDLAIGLRLSLDEAEKIKLRLAKMSDSKKFQDEVDLSSFGLDTDSKRKISLQMAVTGITKPRLEEIFTLIYDQIQEAGFDKLIPAGIVLTGGGALTVDAKEICSQIIPLPLRIAQPPKVGGIVDEILNPAYTSAVGLLMYYLDHPTKLSHAPSPRPTIHLNTVVDKIKSLLEPLLP